ncbi:hypothetical protein FZC79_02010 [Rossellomorea vietnamensis]|uniref:Uncharacterized protein n=1 Tax=Rossellomorea vietnamensis TaxID=218284 RepID=A0A5D4KJY7_9BACI|nr:hypothetical protein [Rossellomorea vietnamensis]TYR77614.1 hypothetical protein FZC79_02010 [Rossellomorea vietnamensis]
MMLSYADVENFVSESRGIKESGLNFSIVTGETTEDMPMGLFIPSSDRDLFEAIHKGAIGSLWMKAAELPAWLPNHFPLFLTDNLTIAALTILDHYYYNTKQEEWGTMTKFIFRDKEKNETYTITNRLQYSETRDLAYRSLLTKGGDFR